jgi:tetratricopeptide (TPR) repeat protein
MPKTTNVIKVRFRKPGRRKVVELPEPGKILGSAELFQASQLAARLAAKQLAESLSPAALARDAADALYRRGSDFDQMGKTTEAETLYLACLEQDPRHAGALVNLGTLIQSHSIRAAQNLYERALEVDPCMWQAHYNMGHCEHELGNWEAAIRHLRTAHLLNPTDTSTVFNLAQCLQSNDQALEARPFWIRYLKADKAGTWAKIARGYLGLRLVHG